MRLRLTGFGAQGYALGAQAVWLHDEYSFSCLCMKRDVYNPPPPGVHCTSSLWSWPVGSFDDHGTVTFHCWCQDRHQKQAGCESCEHTAFCRINRSVSVRTHCTGGVSVTGGLIYILHILHVVGTGDSVLIREVSFIHSVL